MKILSNRKYKEMKDKLDMALFDANLVRCQLDVTRRKEEEYIIENEKLLIEIDGLKTELRFLKEDNCLFKERIKELKAKNKKEEELKEEKKTTRKRTKKEA